MPWSVGGGGGLRSGLQYRVECTAERNEKFYFIGINKFKIINFSNFAKFCLKFISFLFGFDQNSVPGNVLEIKPRWKLIFHNFSYISFELSLFYSAEEARSSESRVKNRVVEWDEKGGWLCWEEEKFEQSVKMCLLREGTADCWMLLSLLGWCSA